MATLSLRTDQSLTASIPRPRTRALRSAVTSSSSGRLTIGAAAADPAPSGPHFPPPMMCPGLSALPADRRTRASALDRRQELVGALAASRCSSCNTSKASSTTTLAGGETPQRMGWRLLTRVKRWRERSCLYVRVRMAAFSAVCVRACERPLVG